MKRIIIFLFSAMIFLSSCGNTGVTESDQQDTASNSAVSKTVSESGEENDTEISEFTGQEEPSDSDYDPNAMGGDTTRWDYSTSYTFIDGELIDYVGDDAFQSWVGEGYNPDVNLQTFIQQFDITKEEFLQVTEQMADYVRLSAEEIDALYSGDQAEINRAFASPYAAVSESGDIYTIFWLAEHDEADYAAAGLTAEAVGKAVDACAELGFVDSYVASVETALASMEDTVTE